MRRIKDFLARQSESSNSTRGTLVALVGGYIAYLGIQMYKDTESGVSSMGMTQTVILMCVMLLIGAAVFAFGAYLFWTGWQREKKNIPAEEDSPAENTVSPSENTVSPAASEDGKLSDKVAEQEQSQNSENRDSRETAAME